MASYTPGSPGYIRRLILLFRHPMSPFEPIGRLGFVKLANPDMYPGHPHSQLLAEYAKEKRF